MTRPDSDPLSIDLYDQPGHLIRRAQQIAVDQAPGLVSVVEKTFDPAFQFRFWLVTKKDS